MRNVQKYIEEYRKKFLYSNKQYATFKASEWNAVIESGKDGNKIDPYDLSANAMYFGFMVGYKAAIREMKDKGRYRGNSSYNHSKKKP